jgi:hypothetical protein
MPPRAAAYARRMNTERNSTISKRNAFVICRALPDSPARIALASIWLARHDDRATILNYA